MKSSTLSIRLDPEMDTLLSQLSKLEGKSKSEVAREALRRQLRLAQLESLRKRTMPFAESRGYLTDEDVFREVS
jgi:predicted transcriptional regulator